MKARDLKGALALSQKLDEARNADFEMATRRGDLKAKLTLRRGDSDIAIIDVPVSNAADMVCRLVVEYEKALGTMGVEL